MKQIEYLIQLLLFRRRQCLVNEQNEIIDQPNLLLSSALILMHLLKSLRRRSYSLYENTKGLSED